MTKPKILLIDKEKLIQEEKERRRRLRIVQVREISKQNSARLRDAYKKEKEKEIRSSAQNKRNILKEEEERLLEQFISLQESEPNHMSIHSEDQDYMLDLRDHFDSTNKQNETSTSLNESILKKISITKHDVNQEKYEQSQSRRSYETMSDSNSSTHELSLTQTLNNTTQLSTSCIPNYDEARNPSKIDCSVQTSLLKDKIVERSTSSSSACDTTVRSSLSKSSRTSSKRLESTSSSSASYYSDTASTTNTTAKSTSTPVTILRSDISDSASSIYAPSDTSSSIRSRLIKMDSSATRTSTTDSSAMEDEPVNLALFDSHMCSFVMNSLKDEFIWLSEQRKSAKTSSASASNTSNENVLQADSFSSSLSSTNNRYDFKDGCSRQKTVDSFTSWLSNSGTENIDLMPIRKRTDSMHSTSSCNDTSSSYSTDSKLEHQMVTGPNDHEENETTLVQSITGEPQSYIWNEKNTLLNDFTTFDAISSRLTNITQPQDLRETKVDLNDSTNLVSGMGKAHLNDENDDSSTLFAALTTSSLENVTEINENTRREASSCVLSDLTNTTHESPSTCSTRLGTSSTRTGHSNSSIKSTMHAFEFSSVNESDMVQQVALSTDSSNHSYNSVKSTSTPLLSASRLVSNISSSVSGISGNRLRPQLFDISLFPDGYPDYSYQLNKTGNSTTESASQSRLVSLLSSSNTGASKTAPKTSKNVSVASSSRYSYDSKSSDQLVELYESNENDEDDKENSGHAQSSQSRLEQTLKQYISPRRRTELKRLRKKVINDDENSFASSQYSTPLSMSSSNEQSSNIIQSKFSTSSVHSANNNTSKSRSLAYSTFDMSRSSAFSSSYNKSESSDDEKQHHYSRSLRSMNSSSASSYSNSRTTNNLSQLISLISSSSFQNNADSTARIIEEQHDTTATRSTKSSYNSRSNYELTSNNSSLVSTSLNNTSSLIRIQQDQLMEQFANMSPI